MAQINTILDKERDRKEIGDYTKINLFVEGSFYRAYEWSAWLTCVILHNYLEAQFPHLKIFWHFFLKKVRKKCECIKKSIIFAGVIC